MTCLSVNRQSTKSVRGFTLIELLVVLVILALAMSIAAPVLFEAGDRGRLDGATVEVYNALRRARSQAVTSGNPVTLDARRLIKDRAIEIEIASSDAPLAFYPDGSATPARLTLAMGAQRRIISIDWLTGHAALAP